MTYAQIVKRLAVLIEAWQDEEGQDFPEHILQHALLVFARNPSLLARNPTLTCCTPAGALRVRWWAADAQRHEEIIIDGQTKEPLCTPPSPSC